MRSFLLIPFVCFSIVSCTAPPSHRLESPRDDQDPSQLYGELFTAVQLAPVFPDSKYFVDMTPKRSPVEIMASFQKEKPADLRQFVSQNFEAPASPQDNYQTNTSEDLDRHFTTLWDHLTRPPDKNVSPYSSLIPLPFSYIVPGGRFREIYYWDSYFTELGLLEDQKDDLFKNMLENFSHLLTTLHHIPNGNRDYYRSRSQPPFFALMVALWQSRFGAPSAVKFLPALLIEHEFWMKGERAVSVDGGVLNRYWDDRNDPRPEAYKEDVRIAEKAEKLYGRSRAETYRELRAGAESGWDYSTRWFKDPTELASIQVTRLLPVDLNSLLYYLEMKISELSLIAGNKSQAESFQKQADVRKNLIHRYLWDEKAGAFYDYHWKNKTRTPELTIATVVPLFVGLATDNQARRASSVIQEKLLKPGGLVTTLRTSGQQWDAPNGWAPHQWMAYAGLKQYHIEPLAKKIRDQWLAINLQVYKSTGKMMEKYNVIDTKLKSGGGEYPTQDGFGWTNGVYRALTHPESSLKHLPVKASAR